MKSCLQCGANAADDATLCSDCGREFAFVTSSSRNLNDTSAFDTNTDPRPTGKNAKGIGGLLLGVGLLAFLFSFMISTASYDSSLDPNALCWKWALTWFGAGLLHLGLLIWLVGYLVHAISFLPRINER